MAAAADAGGAEVHRLARGFCPLHEVLHRLRRMRGIHHQQQPACGHLADRSEVVDRVIRQLGEDRRVDGVLMIGNEQGVAVRGRVLGDFTGVDARGTAAVVHNHLLVPHLRQLGGQQACQEIGGAPGSRRSDDAHRAVRKTVGALGCGRQREAKRRDRGQQGKRESAKFFHEWSPHRYFGAAVGATAKDNPACALLQRMCRRQR